MYCTQQDGGISIHRMWCTHPAEVCTQARQVRSVAVPSSVSTKLPSSSGREDVTRNMLRTDWVVYYFDIRAENPRLILWQICLIRISGEHAPREFQTLLYIMCALSLTVHTVAPAPCAVAARARAAPPPPTAPRPPPPLRARSTRARSSTRCNKKLSSHTNVFFFVKYLPFSEIWRWLACSHYFQFILLITFIRLF